MMRSVFADTSYWVALTDLSDPWRGKALEAGRRLGKARLVTTDAVLAEFLSFLCSLGATARAAGAGRCRYLIDDPNVEVLPQTREAFITALSLYEARPDKTYSLVDCLSMQAMREKRIREVLTHDQHFSQEGFTVLMRE